VASFEGVDARRARLDRALEARWLRDAMRDLREESRLPTSESGSNGNGNGARSGQPPVELGHEHGSDDLRRVGTTS
jgi:hypothetical protein